MEIAAVAVSATDLSRAVTFYEQLGFRFPPLEPDTQHVEAEAGVRLMIDRASLLQELHGEAPRPGNTAGFALLFGAPSEVDEAVGRVAAAGHGVVPEPVHPPWGPRHAPPAGPGGHPGDPFCP